MDFHFASAWEVVADKFPNRVATISDDKPLSWQGFERRASCVASLLEEHGRIALTCFEKKPEMCHRNSVAKELVRKFPEFPSPEHL